MAQSIYNNNEVDIQIEYIDRDEAKINCNGKNLIWISAAEADDFKKELSQLIDKYRI